MLGSRSEEMCLVDTNRVFASQSASCKARMIIIFWYH